MKKIFICIMMVFLFGCAPSKDSSVQKAVNNEISKIANYHTKEIVYFYCQKASVDNNEYNDVYIAKVFSDDNSKYNMNIILDKDFRTVLTSSYVSNIDGSISHVYPISIVVDDKKIDDTYYTETIGND